MDIQMYNLKLLFKFILVAISHGGEEFKKTKFSTKSHVCLHWK